MKRYRRGAAFAALCAAAFLALWYGSYLAAHKRPPLAPQPGPPAPERLSNADLERLHVNEVGYVPVLMYHDITQKERYLGRSVEHFKHDLERLYKEGYRPVSVSEYLSSRMDLPAGTSPVVLTFDDSRKSQFKYLADGSLDPNCAVAILNAFHERHPDFPRKACFYVLPLCAFRQVKVDQMKLRLLTQWSYEIGNHTVTHANLGRLTDAEVQKEIAGNVRLVQRIVPGARVETLAYPGGHPPRNSRLVLSGESGRTRYSNRAAFLAAEAPAPPPVSRRFRPMRIERIEAKEGYTGVDYWLDLLKSGRFARYISDGDINTVALPERFVSRLDRSRVHNARVRAY